MRNHELEQQMANDIYQDFQRKPWRTEPIAPAGHVGYSGPDAQPEPDNEEEEGQ